MRSSRTLVFLAVFIVISAAFSYFKFRESEKQRDFAKLAESEVLFSAPVSEEINYLSFERPGNPMIMLKKQGSNWQIVSPVNTQADQMVVRGIVAALRFGRKEESFDSEEDSGSYGFKNPRVKLTLGTSKSFRKSALLFGNKVPLKNLYYAKWEGNPRAFFITDQLWKSFDRNLLSLRRRLVFDFQPEDLKGFRICNSGKYFDIFKENGHWIFPNNSPNADEKVDPVEANAYIELLRSVIIGEFLDGKNWQDESFGLRLKQNYVSVYFQNAKPQILYLGYPSRELEGTYAHQDKVFDLVLVHSRLVRALQRDAQSFYFRRIWHELPKEIDRIQFEKGDVKWSFLKRAGVWRKSEGANLAPDKEKWLENTLAVIYELKYVSAFESNLKETLAGQDTFRIKLFSADSAPEKPVFEMNVSKKGSKTEGVANILDTQESEKYEIFRLNPKDAEILTDLALNLM